MSPRPVRGLLNILPASDRQPYRLSGPGSRPAAGPGADQARGTLHWPGLAAALPAARLDQHVRIFLAEPAYGS